MEAVQGDGQFEAALSFPRAPDEDRADRIVDFEHLQVGRKLLRDAAVNTTVSRIAERCRTRQVTTRPFLRACSHWVGAG